MRRGGSHEPRGGPPSDEIEVPSSAPDQDIPKETAIKDEGKARTRPKRTTRVTANSHANKRRKIDSNTPVAHRVKRERRAVVNARISDQDEEDDEEDDEEEDEDEEEEDDEDDFTPEPTTKKRKRKASISPKIVRGTSRTSTRAGTASVHQREQSLSSAISIEPATRVYAWWRADSHYYSGAVQAAVPGSTTRFQIYFDDESKADVDIDKLRRCILRVGDEVVVKDTKAKVTNVDDFASRSVVTVRMDYADEDDTMEVELRDTAIASRTIASHWKDRTLQTHDITTVERPTVKREDPSSTAASTYPRRLMHKTGFVVSLSTVNGDDQKARITKCIKASGGRHIDDWPEVFSLEGEASDERWVAEPKDIKWKGTNISRIFLLADEENHKPKYLIALALGIPCLKVSWLTEAIARVSHLHTPNMVSITTF